MANNQAFLTGTGGAGTAYTVATTDLGTNLHAQQMHPLYFDGTTWQTISLTNRLPVTLSSAVMLGTAVNPTTAISNLYSGVDASGNARALTLKTINSTVTLNTTNVLSGTGGSNAVTLTANATATQLGGGTPTSNPANQFVSVQNSKGSTGILYYGYSSGVNASTGMELGIGELINLPIDNTNKLWFFSATGTTVTAKLGWL